MREMSIKIKFSKDMPEPTLKQLKDELVNRQQIPEKLSQIFRVLDNRVEVSVEYK